MIWDKKWIYSWNPENHEYWIQEKIKITKICRIRVWWNFKQIIHFKIMLDVWAINPDFCCKQLDRLYASLNIKYFALINISRAFLQHDNTSLHISQMTNQKLKDHESKFCLTQNIGRNLLFRNIMFLSMASFFFSLEDFLKILKTLN